MKNRLIIGLLVLLPILACTGVKTRSGGLENEAYLVFIGKPADYKEGIQVELTDTKAFTAEVTTDESAQPKGKVYAIKPGKHLITVRYQRKVVYSQQIFVSVQETKKIYLP